MAKEPYPKADRKPSRKRNGKAVRVSFTKDQRNQIPCPHQWNASSNSCFPHRKSG